MEQQRSQIHEEHYAPLVSPQPDTADETREIVKVAVKVFLIIFFSPLAVFYHYGTCNKHAMHNLFMQLAGILISIFLHFAVDLIYYHEVIFLSNVLALSGICSLAPLIHAIYHCFGKNENNQSNNFNEAFLGGDNV